MIPNISPDIEVVAIGTGRSFLNNFRDPLFNRRDNPYPKLYGCSFVSNMIQQLTVYCYGDLGHRHCIPNPEHEFHPGVRCYATNANLLSHAPWLRPFAELEIPHGCTSGGMAFSLACLENRVIGIIGFDGNRDDFESDIKYDHYQKNFLGLIHYWQNRGRRIISLMESSPFNFAVEPCIKVDHTSDPFFDEGKCPWAMGISE